MAENNTNKKVHRPSYGIFGLSNESGTEVLNVNAIVAEPFKKGQGLNRYTDSGIDGKGKEGTVGLVEAHDLDEAFTHVGEVVAISDKTVTLKSVTLPNPENTTERYVLFYDTRKVSKNGKGVMPLKVIKETIEEKDGKRKVSKAELVNTSEIVLKDALITKDDAKKAAMLAIALSGKAEMRSGFKEELAKKGITKLSGTPDYIAFLQIFDKYYPVTDENAALAAKLRRENKLKFEFSDAFEDEDVSISDSFTMQNLDRIVVGDLASARALKGIIDVANGQEPTDDLKQKIENPENGLDRLIPERIEYIKRINEKRGEGNRLFLSIRNMGEVVTGYDNTGNIIVMENYGVKTKTNGEIYKDGKLSELLTPSREAYKNIDYAMKDGDYTPSEDKVAKSVDLLISEAQRLSALHYGEGADELIGIPKEGASLASDILNGKEDDKWHAYGKMKDLHSFVTKGIVKEFMKEYDISDNDFLVKDKNRIRKISFANNEPERFATSVLGINSKYQNISINAKLPSLTFPVEGNAINFKEYTAPAISVYIDKENGEVVGLSRAASVASWIKGKGRLGAVINAVLKIDSTEKGAEKKAKDLINYGMKIGKKNTGFGLLAIMKESPVIKERLGKYLNEIYNTIKEHGLDAGKDLISDYMNPDTNDRTLATFGRYLREVSEHIDRNRALSAAYFALRKDSTVDIVKDILNGKDVSFKNENGENLDAKTIMDIKFASTVIDRDIQAIRAAESTDAAINIVSENSPMFQSYEKAKERGVKSPLEHIASELGYAIGATTALRGIVSYKGEDGNRRYFIDRSVHKYPAGADFNTFVNSRWDREKGEREVSVDVKAAQSVGEPVATFDISEELKAIKQEYMENRPAPQYKTDADRMVDTILKGNENFATTEDDIIDISAMFTGKDVDTAVVEAVSVSAEEIALQAAGVEVDTKEHQEAEESKDASTKQEEGGIGIDIHDAESANPDDVVLSDAEMDMIIDQDMIESMELFIGDLDGVDESIDQDGEDADIAATAKNMEKTAVKVDASSFKIPK